MLIKEILKRRSVREYKPESVPQEYVVEIIKAGRLAPTAQNNQAVEFVVIGRQGIKDDIFKIVGQDYVRQAPVLIMPVTDTTKTNCPVPDLSVASENMLLQAVALGLGAVWKHLEPAAAEEIKEMLGIPKKYMAINLIPLGYPQKAPEPRNGNDSVAGKMHEEKW